MDEVNESGIPRINAALLIYSNNFNSIVAAKHDLEICLKNPLIVSEYSPEPNCGVIRLIETGYIRSWYLSEVIVQMFQLFRDEIDEIKMIKKKYGCTAQIDIAFYHYETFPALLLDGDAMENIIKLEAEISIDPY